MGMSFTTKYNRLTNRLINKVSVISALNEIQECHALWDTGATNTCISKKMAEQLKLIPVGSVDMKTPGGISHNNTYVIDIKLPNNVLVKDVLVTESEIGNQGIDVLIGMDIITIGDFAVSNYNGITQFTFRFPSQSHVDYVD